LGVLPSDPCSDSEFIRRATLDAAGHLPAPERVRAFLADSSPDKRARLAQELLADPNWADHWATKWRDITVGNTQRIGVKPVYLLDHWIRRKFRENTPYDQFARELLTAEGNTHRDGPVALFRDRTRPRNAECLCQPDLPRRAARLREVPPSSERKMEPGRLLPDGRLLQQHAEQRTGDFGADFW